MALYPIALSERTEPLEVAGDRCGDCSHYADLLCARQGLCGLVGVCCVARDGGQFGELTNVDPADEPCGCFERAVV